ncbi:MAG: tetratricopeptide repeat protein [Gemmatimonadota bacterium]|nr:MAG: tetratricopeptide repeat protein [Gemmatimonadota bacterium]
MHFFSRQFNNRVLILPIFLMIVIWCPVHCQEETRESIDKIIEAYTQFQFTDVITLAHQALTTDPPPSEEIRVQIYTYLGFAYTALGENDKAKENFEEALTLDPSLTLDPIYVSPKIIAIFSEAKAAVETSQEKIEREPVQPFPISITKDKRSGGAWRSLLVPGWGQLYKGQKQKALAIFTVHTINLGATLYLHLKMEDAHDEYRRARDPVTIEATYDRYNSYHKKRNYLLIFTALVWISSHIDAAVSQPKSDVSDGKSTSFIPEITPTSFNLTCSIRF